MKKILTVLSAMAMLMLVSCNNDSEKTAEDAPATIPSASYKVMIVRFPVTDYSRFHTAYEMIV